VNFGTTFEPGTRRIKSGSDIIKLPKDGNTIRFRQIAGTPWVEYHRIFLKTEENGEAKNVMVPFPAPPDDGRRLLLPDGQTLWDKWAKKQTRYRAIVWSYDDKAVQVLDAPSSVFDQMSKMIAPYGLLDGYDLTITGDSSGPFVKYTVNTPPKGDEPLDGETLGRIDDELPAMLKRQQIATSLEDICERIPGATLLPGTFSGEEQSLLESEPPEGDE
jgi:hypothetical protein